MGTIDAGKWIMWLTLYFFLMFTVVISANNIFPFYGSETIDQSGADFQNKINPFQDEGQCTTPRTIYTQATRSTFATSGTTCQYLGNGMSDPTTCGTIDGCAWTSNITYVWFLTKDVPEYCGGDINFSAYNNGTDLFIPDPKSVCGMSDLQDNESLCEVFSCNYVKYSELGNDVIGLDDKVSYSSVWDSVKFITGFDVSLDIPEAFQWIFAGLFFWLPFIGLVIAVYFALPFLH